MIIISAGCAQGGDDFRWEPSPAGPRGPFNIINKFKFSFKVFSFISLT
jgi:hypothetical protein